MATGNRLCNQPVLALTVRPPWSHWIAAGIKLIENRIWAPPGDWRGRLVIHAGKNIDFDGFQYASELGHDVDIEDLNIGEFIAVADLIGVHQAGLGCIEAHKAGEGNLRACVRWGASDQNHWVLKRVRTIPPVAGTGRQKLFLPPPSIAELALAA
jgi:hypothetical protein